jgi:hydroxymethylpyrimidine kinase/phosphomethylpyrimidine kinase
MEDTVSDHSDFPIVLSIAGHDCSNGAGITKDLEIFAHLGLFGLSAPTAFVIQGPCGVRDVQAVDIRVFSDILEEVGKGFSLKGIKIGVVPDQEHLRAIVSFLRRNPDVFVVLDPVFSAKNGTSLITGKGLETVRNELLPLIDCLTPNLDEASLLLGRTVSDESSMENAAHEIAEMGPDAVVLKGGHLEGDPCDVLVDGTLTTFYRRRRIEKVVHGTGCIFSSALLSFHVRGSGLKDAFLSAERFVGRLIEKSFQPVKDGYHYASVAFVGESA